MVNTIAGFPVQEVQFTKEGNVYDTTQVAAVHTMLASITDLLVLAHGWNDNLDEARSLFTAWLTGLAAAPSTAHWSPPRKVGVLEVFWPSKKFTDPGETAGGGAALGDDQAALASTIDQLGGIAPPDTIATLKGLADSLQTDATARTAFVQAVVGVIGSRSSLDGENQVEVPSALFDADGDLLAKLGQAGAAPVDPNAGGAADFGMGLGAAAGAAVAGGDASLGQFIGGAIAGARNLLNYATYYTMKERAGDVGSIGLGPVLTSLRSQVERVHMVGHSFGCRLLSASLRDDGNATAAKVSSMVLLEAAFSQNGYAVKFDGTNDGYFRSVVANRHVTGPIVISHSMHDTAVGIAYPLASRIAGQNASFLGGPTDPFGGMGRNGAQHTPEAVDADMLAVGTPYAGLGTQIVLNLCADAYISGHSDVTGPQVMETISQTIGAVT